MAEFLSSSGLGQRQNHREARLGNQPRLLISTRSDQNFAVVSCKLDGWRLPLDELLPSATQQRQQSKKLIAMEAPVARGRPRALI